jgi:hypothetical protein
MPLHIHTAILDVAVIAGGVAMISAAVRALFFQFGRRDAAGCRNPAASQTERLRNLALLVFLVLVFVAFFLVVFILVRIAGVRHFEDGQRKGFAKQVAFAAHPQAYDRVFVHFRHRERMTAGF